MDIPFTIEQFLKVFRDYNEAIWPVQVAAYAIGAVCLVAVLSRSDWGPRVTFAGLAALWLWNGVVYHFHFFRAINPAALLFAVLFIFQAFLFARAAFAPASESRASKTALVVGWASVLYGTLVYPLLGAQWGHVYPESPVFGVAPCPTTVFTFGLLMLAGGRGGRHLLLIPAFWAAIGTVAALRLGIREDFGLAVFALAAIACTVTVRTVTFAPKPDGHHPA